MQRVALLTALLTVAGIVDAPLCARASDQRGEFLLFQATPLQGNWAANIAKSKLDPQQPFRRATLHISITGHTLTMATVLVDASGAEKRLAETFRTDGIETRGTLSAGVTLIAKWLDPHVLASLAKKDGRVTAIVIYEVSEDGATLTSRSSGSVEQVIVFDRM